MTYYTRGTVKRAYKHVQGAVLGQALTGTWAQGDSMTVEAATDFSPTGGDGVFEPGTVREEAFSYSGIIINASDAANALDAITGVIRPAAQAHTSGTFIQEGLEETIEKHVDIEIDGELLTAIPVDPLAYPLVKLGTYEEADMPVVPVEFSPEGLARVSGGAVGSIPWLGSDLETMPTPGGGPEVGPDFPPGQDGWEDGEPPSEAPTISVFGAIGELHVRLNTIENSTVVNYKVFVDTASVPDPPNANQLVGVLSLAGLPDYPGVFVVKDFPSGHVLDGGANDPVKAGVTYNARVVPADASGDGPASAQASATPVLVQTVDVQVGAVTVDLIAANAVTTTKIADDSISTPKLIAGAVTAVKISAGAVEADKIAANAVTAVKILAGAIETDKLAANAVTSDKIAANTIVAGDIAANTITGAQIAATTITADKLSVSTLSAITANLGTVTAGSMSSVTLTAGTISATSISGGTISGTVITGSSVGTASSSPRGASAVAKLENAEINFVVQETPTPDVATIQAGTSTATGLATLYLSGQDVVIEASLKVDVGSTSTRNLVELRTTGSSPSAPGTGRCIIFYDGAAGTNGVLKARNPTSTQTLATF